MFWGDFWIEINFGLFNTLLSKSRKWSVNLVKIWENGAGGEGEDVRKIVVFDSGWGGELVADFLMQELRVVEVVRVIDWAHETYAGATLDVSVAAECLAPYIGKVDLIVLGGYTVGVMLSALRRVYPEQEFVAPSINYDKMLRSRQYPENVAILMNCMLRDSALFRELRERLPFSTLVLPECTNWEYLIDNNLMTKDVVRTELAWDFEINIDGLDELMRTKREKNLEFSSLEMLAERSSGKRALMQAIQNFSMAARVADLEERKATAEVAQSQKDFLRNDTTRVRVKPDLVLLLNTYFWEIKPEIERALGWQVRVLDFREKLLHDVCAALKLRGVDGRRAK